MLVRDGIAFTTGRSRYEERPGRGGELKIFVRIKAPGWSEVIDAQFDTGAAWSMLDREVAEELGLLNGEGEAKEISTWRGTFRGQLKRVPVLLLADHGDSLHIEATVWVSRDWEAGNFLGYRGFLERVCFGIDPADRTFHFGPYERHHG